ncbi:MAG: hypothetical protein WC437_00210 [Patescibacteria group bacterium]|jgi:hypothetical protein|nr:hypothetical protein [Patescibacteria group bacterium]
MRIVEGEGPRFNRHDRKRGMGPKKPICPNCKQRLWLNNSVSLTIEEMEDLDISFVDGRLPIFCRTCDAEVSKVVYDLIDELLAQGDRVYDWFKAGQPSLHVHPSQIDIICR